MECAYDPAMSEVSCASLHIRTYQFELVVGDIVHVVLEDGVVEVERILEA
jgi:hypothetical protein